MMQIVWFIVCTAMAMLRLPNAGAITEIPNCMGLLQSDSEESSATALCVWRTIGARHSPIQINLWVNIGHIDESEAFLLFL